MKTVAGKHRRRQVVGTLAPLGLVAVGWLGMGVLPGAAAPTAAPLTVTPPAAPDTSQADASPATADQVGQADADDLQLAAATRNALLDTATTTDIPAKALAAYQRAALVIDSSDKSCHLDWTLLAGIGKVESDNGRTGRGRSDLPGIFGIPLNGKNHTAKVLDTDGGKIDGSKRFDRAVGPMQFLPSTWAVVGVDGNGDGKRDPQNISDAALGAAVYLCGNSDDLATKSGQRAAVHRYNHSDSYVDLVIAIARSYAASQPAQTFVAPHAVQIGGSSAPAAPGAVGAKAPATAKTPTTSKAPTKTPTKTPSTPTTPVTPGGGTPTTGGGGSTTPPVPKVVVPVVVGQTQAAATSALTTAGVKTGVIPVYSSQTAAGLVISSDQAAGTKVDKDSTVTLTVSLGPVPSMVGLSSDVAQADLMALATPLNSLVVVQEAFSDVPAGQVVSQSQATVTVAGGGTITLTVSKGPDPNA